ncbi:MAG TPA: GntR family transcriptional regulator [Phycisphaerae bacterium]|nr:GntR family transcriptional regulator [Phycisphaerae bacterium]
MVTRPSHCAGTTPSSPRLSYKFQRLREQIRAAIAGGEFAGQLPGERELGRRFAANAKTINKALCDLSSEGLLIRRIGRGTFVATRNGQAAESARARSCILLMPTEPEPRSGRHALLAELQRILEDKGASLDPVPLDRLVDGQIPLAGWPSDRRRRTAALACFPIDPLSGGRGHLSDDCILESYRRHVPAVVIGALSRSARLSAVAPDYCDAGLRLAEHLFRSGCGGVVVVTSGEGREAEMVAAGARAAGIQQGRCVTPVVLNDGAVLDPSAILPLCKSHDQANAPAGVLCVGTTALETLAADEILRQRVADGFVLLAGVTEPGDGAADRLSVTSYEVRPQRIAEWAARLLVESRQGERPLEILIVGDVKIRESHRSPVGPVAARPRRPGGRHRRPRCGTGVL